MLYVGIVTRRGIIWFCWYVNKTGIYWSESIFFHSFDVFNLFFILHPLTFRNLPSATFSVLAKNGVSGHTARYSQQENFIIDRKIFSVTPLMYFSNFFILHSVTVDDILSHLMSNIFGGVYWFVFFICLHELLGRHSINTLPLSGHCHRQVVRIATGTQCHDTLNISQANFNLNMSS